MTSMLERVSGTSKVSSADTLPIDTIDTLPLPMIDVTDGYGTGLKLTEAIETFANEAEEIGIPYDSDGTLQIGDNEGDRIIIEQTVVDAKGNEPASVINTLLVVAHSKHAFYRFRSEVTSNGDFVEFQVDEETSEISRHGEFSGKNGRELPADAIEPTLHLTETMIQVADSLYKNRKISEDAREEVVEHLATQEAARQDQATKIMGSAALGKLLTNFRVYRAA